MTMSLVDKLASRVTRAATLKPMPSRLKKPVASISFDDFPRSAMTVGARILRDRRVKGTYYVSGRFLGVSEDDLDYFEPGDLRALAEDGHEIGCHTFSHPHLGQRDPAAWREELRRNREFLREELPGAVFSTFAYPYGETSLRAKIHFGRRFAACRGIVGGVNHGVVDLSQLKAVGVESRHFSEDVITAAIDAAVDTCGWLIFFTHDVSDAPSPYGAQPQMLEFVLDRLADAGIETLTVKHALARTVAV